MIKVLDKSVADKIAAGEVIERPLSIVKELVENAIDADASSIVVEIRHGGKAYIRVTDDGCGIAADEVETAFLRHATSKIKTAGDLQAINTLGFRGEALASICAVTRTELLTKCREAKTGKRLVLHGGEVLTNQQTGCPDGTTLIVTDLFYNTPARQKFLKTDGAESGMIIDFLSQMALAYPHIRFRLVNNGHIVFSTTGDGDRRNAIIRVFPQVNPRDLTAVYAEDNGMILQGYISTPARSSANRRKEIFFVNGRVVNSKVMEKGIDEGYRERLFAGRYPVAFLFLQTDPHTLDVNIHPNKREVRFDREEEIMHLISTAIKAALGTKAGMVSGASVFHEEKQIYQAERKAEKQVDIKNILSTIQNVRPDSQISAEPLTKADTTASPDPKEEIPQKQESLLQPPIIEPFAFETLTVTGTLFHTYITAVDEDSFYLIDQHAAHERIFYEKLVSAYEREEKLRQPILMPFMIDIAPAAEENKDRWFSALSAMGYTMEEFGQNTYRITEVPAFMTLTEAEDFLHEFLDQAETGVNLRNTVMLNKLIMQSCKSAVKAHDVLSSDEVQTLLADLQQCVNPFSCPHGRPTFVRLTRYEIERLFKRIQS